MDNNNDDAITYMNKKIYGSFLNEIEKDKEKSNSKLLINAYYKSRPQLKINYNWSFHFFEVIFYCFYLNFAHCQKLLYDNYKNNTKIYNDISKYLDNYEKRDYYFNFINEEGALLNITRIIQIKLYKVLNANYFKQKIFVRRKLLREHKYYLISKNKDVKINIFKKPNNYGIDETNKEVHDIILDVSNSLGFFKNSYNDLNDNLKRFFFVGYDENKISTVDEFCSDLNKIYEQINQINNNIN